MPTPPITSFAKLRLLECWLPLAQELNQAEHWDADGQTLESLILAAAPALIHVEHIDAARAILMVYHALLRKG